MYQKMQIAVLTQINSNQHLKNSNLHVQLVTLQKANVKVVKRLMISLYSKPKLHSEQKKVQPSYQMIKKKLPNADGAKITLHGVAPKGLIQDLNMKQLKKGSNRNIELLSNRFMLNLGILTGKIQELQIQMHVAD